MVSQSIHNYSIIKFIYTYAYTSFWMFHITFEDFIYNFLWNFEINVIFTIFMDVQKHYVSSLAFGQIWTSSWSWGYRNWTGCLLGRMTRRWWSRTCWQKRAYLMPCLRCMMNAHTITWWRINMFLVLSRNVSFLWSWLIASFVNS